MSLRKLTATLVGALLVAAVPAAAQDAPAPASQEQVFSRLSDAEVAARVQSALAKYMVRAEFVGLSVAVARGDHVIVDEGVGTADLEWKLPADASTPFRIGSVTKQFTAAAIMKLAEQGKLGLDNSIAEYVPDFDTAGHTVTVRELLNHASGIPNYTAQPDFMTKFAARDLRDEELLATIKGVPFDFEPGTRWNYSNTNYYLLGMIVAKVSGTSYADYMQRTFFDPLGLTHTRYGATGPIIPNRVSGYSYDPGTQQHLNAAPISMKVPGGAGGLISTAGDLVRWQMALTGGTAVSPASYEQMITSTVPTGQGSARYGFGLMVDEADGLERIWHNGGINGFNSVLSYVPALGLRLAVISNSEALPSELVGRDIYAALTSDKPLSALRTAAQPGSEAALRKLLEGIAGGNPDYTAMTPQFAEVVRSQQAQIQPAFERLGPIASITFTGVGVAGLDTFRVDFAKGAIVCQIGLLPDGTVAGMAFRLAPPAGAK